MSERHVSLKDLKEGVELATGEAHRLVLSVHDRVEIEGVFFNHDSALFLPDAPHVGGRGKAVERPFSNTAFWQALRVSHREFSELAQESFDPEAHSERQVGVFALVAVLRHIEARPGNRLVVAGHTDTVGDAAYNEKLSERRAANVVALLEGDRTAFVKASAANHTANDDAVVLRYLARTRGWPCDVSPGQLPSSDDIKAFQKSYNDSFDDKGESSLFVDGVVGPQTLGAYFDVMEADLAARAGGGVSLALMRQKVAYVDPGHKTLACGERYPIEGAGADNFKSLTNRRVEILLFDVHDLPDLKGPKAADNIYRKRFHALKHAALRGDEPARRSSTASAQGQSFALVKAPPPPEGVGEPAEPLVTTMVLRPGTRTPNDAWAFLEPLDEAQTAVVRSEGTGPIGTAKA